jgi:hypothetical protein
MRNLLWFSLMDRYEHVHPLEGGALRLKYRRDRRHGMRRENPLVFYPRYWAETLKKLAIYTGFFLRWNRVLKEVRHDPDRAAYTDLAITPPDEAEFETLDLYHATAGGEAALARKRRDDALRAKMATT